MRADPAGARHLKKSHQHLLAQPAVKYQFIAEHCGDYPVTVMCHVLEISISGYDAWHNRKPSQHCREDATLAAKVEAAFEHNRRVYGSPRIHAELHAEGIACGQKRVARLMRELGISAQLPKHRTVTTHSEKGAPVAANLLQRDFHADRPNQKWTTDTTSIWTKVGWLYLAVVLDVFSRMVVGWSLAAIQDATLVAQALLMALARLAVAPRRRSYITRIVGAPIPVKAIWSWYRSMACYQA